MVIIAEPDGEETADARNHAADVAAYAPFCGDADVGLGLAEAEAHFELGGTAAKNDFVEIVGGEGVEFVIV